MDWPVYYDSLQSWLDLCRQQSISRLAEHNSRFRAAHNEQIAKALASKTYSDEMSKSFPTTFSRPETTRPVNRQLAKSMGTSLMTSAPFYRSVLRHLQALSDSTDGIFGDDSIFNDEDFELVLLIEHMGRVVYTFIESVLLSHAFVAPGPGGATLGKWLMNLRVVTAREIIQHPESVEVLPGTDLGFMRAFMRSVLKILGHLPIFPFLWLIAPWHRGTYDILVGSLVVQLLPATGDGA